MRDFKEEIRSRLPGLGLSPARENEIIEELSQHLDDRWRELIERPDPYFTPYLEGEEMRLRLA